MVTNEDLEEYLEDISASTAGPQNVERVDCVKCSSFTFHDSRIKYNAEVVTVLNGRHAVEYYSRYAEEWVKKFSTFTNTVWCPIRADCKRLPFRKTYKCHHKARGIIISADYTKISQNIHKLVGGPQDCQSHIIFKFRNPRRQKKKGTIITTLIDNSYCKRVHIQNYFLELASGDKSWTQEYLCDIAGPPQDHRDPLVSIDEVYYRYFADGHTYLTAKMLHQLTLICNENKDVLSDHTKNPTTSYVKCIYRYYNNCTKDHTIKLEVIMSRKQAEMERLGGLMRFQSPDMVTIITPTMKRVLASYELDEVIISSTAVSQGPSVTLFFIPSKIGSLCFACVLHETKEAYSKVFLTLKSVVEEIYMKIFKPKSIVIVDISSTEQRNAAEIVFQNSKVSIAPWSVCNLAWIWICNSKSTTRRSRNDAMLGFHDIMYAADAESAYSHYTKFASRMHLTDFKFFKDYLDDIWKQYSLKIWWSSANNNLVALSITLIQQLFVKKCASFKIINMCDVVDILDKHYQQILLGWVDKKQPILKIHTKFQDKSKLNMVKFELTSPYAFSVDCGFVTNLRTDTWSCECPIGKKALYCEHLYAFMDLADVTISLSDDEKRLLKHIAGENNYTAVDADGNCANVTKVHRTYTDGYYLFYLPTNINLLFTWNWKSIELSLSDKESYILNINDFIENYKLKTGISDEVHDEDKGKDVEIITKSDKSPDKSVAGLGDIDIVENLKEFVKGGKVVQKYTNRKKPVQINNKTMDTESVTIQNNNLFEGSNPQKSNSGSEISFHIKQENEELINIEENTRYNIQTNDPHSKESIHQEIDLKIDIMCTEGSDKKLKEENTFEEFVNAECSVNYFEAEYTNALYNLRNEFMKFIDRLGPSPSGSNLERIVRLMKEFSATRAEILGIKSEPEDPIPD